MRDKRGDECRRIKSFQAKFRFSNHTFTSFLLVELTLYLLLQVPCCAAKQCKLPIYSARSIDHDNGTSQDRMLSERYTPRRKATRDNPERISVKNAPHKTCAYNSQYSAMFTVLELASQGLLLLGDKYNSTETTSTAVHHKQTSRQPLG